jgi:hypothetical protein
MISDEKRRKRKEREKGLVENNFVQMNICFVASEKRKFPSERKISRILIIHKKRKPKYIRRCCRGK